MIHDRQIQDLYKQKKSLELDWDQEFNRSGKYNLRMVEIDKTIQGVISQIKHAEEQEEQHVIKVESLMPEISIAG